MAEAAKATTPKKPGFLAKVVKDIANNPGTVIKLFVITLVIGTLVYFVIKYWKVIKWVGPAAALALMFPFLVDIIGGIVGAAGAALGIIGNIAKGKGDKNAKDNKDDPEGEKKADDVSEKEMDPIADKTKAYIAAEEGKAGPATVNGSNGARASYDTTEEGKERMRQDAEDGEFKGSDGTGSVDTGDVTSIDFGE